MRETDKEGDRTETREAAHGKLCEIHPKSTPAKASERQPERTRRTRLAASHGPSSVASGSRMLCVRPLENGRCGWIESVDLTGLGGWSRRRGDVAGRLVLVALLGSWTRLATGNFCDRLPLWSPRRIARLRHGPVVLEPDWPDSATPRPSSWRG
jgi:hypothetical protein